MDSGIAANDGRANLVRAFKASGCKECGVRYPEIDWSDLHVDHIDPRDKSYGGSLRLSRFSTEQLLSELINCQVLCSCCHKTKHRNGSNTIEAQLYLFSGNTGWRFG